MTEQASTILVTPLRRQGDAPVGRITDDEIEATIAWCLLQAITDPDHGRQAGARRVPEIAERDFEENLRHPGGKRVQLEAVEPEQDVLERILYAAALQTGCHTAGHWRQECPAAASGVEDPHRAQSTPASVAMSSNRSQSAGGV